MKNQNLTYINRILFIVIGILVILVARDYLPENNGNDAERHLNRGWNLVDDFRYSEGLSAFNAAINAQPRYAEAYAGRCFAYSQLERFEEALADCERALELKSSLNEVHTYFCAIYAKQEDFEQAEPACDEAMRSNPTNFNAPNVMGILHARRGEYEEAVEYYTQSLEINPEAGVVYSNRGRSYEDLGDIDAAIADYQTAILYANYYDFAYLRLIPLLIQVEDYDAALDAAHDMSIFLPERAEPYVWQAQVYILQDNQEAAFEALGMAIETDANFDDTYAVLLSLYSLSDKPVEDLPYYCDYLTWLGGSTLDCTE